MPARTHAVVDEPYPQKRAQKLLLPGGRHPNDVRRIVRTPGGHVWVGTCDGLYAWQDDAFERLPDDVLGCGDIRDLAVDRRGRLVVTTLLTVAILDAEGSSGSIDLPDIWGCGLGGLLSATCVEDRLFAVTSDAGFGEVVEGAFAAHPEFYPGSSLAIRLQSDGSRALWILGDAGARRLSITPSDITSEESVLEGIPVRAVARHPDGDILLATSAGLMRKRGLSIEKTRTPVEDVHDVAVDGDGDVWLATSSGVCRHDAVRTHYYSGRRWLPNDDARGVLPVDDATTLVATAGGCARLTHAPTTLADKAEAFDTLTRARHLRLKGFVAASRLAVPGDVATSTPAPSDNDGLWTALYLAAQSYRFAVTGEEEARRYAAQAFDAMAWLEAVTTVDGYPTKAVVRADEETGGGSVPWHPSADGRWLWKGDCSSDEIDGHLYGCAIYYDLAATDEEKTRVRTHVRRILNHIIDSGYFIVGPDGKPTRWGVWSPEYLNGPWRAQQGLNSLEILAHLRTAHHITGDARYETEYHRLVESHHYAQNVGRQKLTFPGHVNHSDDELAFISYDPLLRYEQNPGLRAIYLDSLEHAWSVERPERNPLWNFIYGAATGNANDIEAAVRTLRELPMDLVDWPIRNSHRRDIDIAAVRGRFGELQSVDVLPYDELSVLRWNANPYRLDGAGQGTKEEDGAFFLLPYWMGRHYGFIA